MVKFKNKNTLKELEAELQQELALPDEVQVTGFLGRGRRSFSYKGEYNDKAVVIKVYRKEFIEKYRRKCNVDIAEFEYERNSILHGIDAIRPYIATPYKVFPQDSGYTHSFVQEFVDGITLMQLISKTGYLPQEVLAAGYEIVRSAEACGVHDIDISLPNIMVTQRDGVWMPRLYDFNILPQHMSPPNPFIALGIKAGLCKKSRRDYRSLRNWKRVGEQQQLSGNH